MSKLTAQTIISEARKYLGLPYKNQGRDVTGASAGLDCGGLLVMVCTNLNITDADISGYANSPDGSFEAMLNEHLIEIIPKEDAKIGDILAIAFKENLIQHVAFVTETQPRIKILHAKRPREGFGSTDRGVVEQYLHGYDLRGWAKTYRIRGINVE